MCGRVWPQIDSNGTEPTEIGHQPQPWFVLEVYCCYWCSFFFIVRAFGCVGMGIGMGVVFGCWLDRSFALAEGLKLKNALLQDKAVGRLDLVRTSLCVCVYSFIYGACIARGRHLFLVFLLALTLFLPLSLVRLPFLTHTPAVAV